MPRKAKSSPDDTHSEAVEAVLTKTADPAEVCVRHVPLDFRHAGGARTFGQRRDVLLNQIQQNACVAPRKMARMVWPATALALIGMSGSRRTIAMISGRNATHTHQIATSYVVTRIMLW